MKALIFDVDGTLAETEGLHLRAFNAAFEASGLDWHWDDALNTELLAVSGAIERMTFFQSRLPEAARQGPAMLREILSEKRRVYADFLARGDLDLRAGVRDLLAAARAHDLQLAVATAASHASLDALSRGCLGAAPREVFDVVVTGDDVARKKPDPEAYQTTLARLGCGPDEALVFEDSPVGYAAARAARLTVVVTPSQHGPQDADYPEALAVVPSLEQRFWPRFGFPPAVA